MRREKLVRLIFFFLFTSTFLSFLYFFYLSRVKDKESRVMESTSNNILNSTIQKDKLVDSDEKSNNLNSNSVGICPPCKFTPLNNHITSTKRDVVLAAALSKLKRVETFLRTLRTTGSRCRVILFLDNVKTIEHHFLRFFSSCQIEPVFVPKASYNDHILKEFSKMSRYYYYQQWLRIHIEEVDRVLHTDTFDVIFQSDPFIDNTNFLPLNQTNLLYFTFEPVSIGESRWTAEWIAKCYGPNIVHKYKKKPVSCSGVTLGHAKAFLKYLDIMIGKKHWKTCFGDSLDQAHHNYILYHGDLNSAGLVVKSLDCNSQFLTMHFCCKIGKCKYDVESEIVYGNNTNIVPVLVHQYNRWKNLTKRNENFCPGTAKNLYQSENSGKLADIGSLPQLENNLPEVK
ncbi:hypothetical protein TRFO_01596 [Tritrichomonas foetus]|uniref:Nucleotide-diphospho-sugar transferase domain-containing protein n=1 Tax=Tritrichomonas foetus TaxID=1144522 RepID=A0A1J4JXZ9_9EUKA|nr:hypothetical protein TRFO_01596 [Tritrichomonas foetus]|eukprot:OHT03867.1 hypothetical protein TRFO_01596 [Tritrichomonas foetus]